MTTNAVTLCRNGTFTTGEIVELQKQCGSDAWGCGTEQVWLDVVERAVATASLRNSEDKLVGIGFLVGNTRHAQLANISVHPEYQRDGLGRQIVDELIAASRDANIRYVACIRDPSRPWLKEFYRKHGLFGY